MSFRTFISRFQVQALWAAFKAAYTRFPLTMTCSLALLFLSVCLNHDIKLADDDTTARLSLWFGMLGWLGLSVKLWVEARGASVVMNIALSAAGAAVTAAACFVPAEFSTLHVFLGAAIALSLLFAPYIGGDADEDSVWYCNYLNAITLALGTVSTLVLAIGACAILASMNYLFEMDIPGEYYADIWMFSTMAFGPVVFLSYLTREFRFAKSDCDVHAGVAFIANYLLVPLMLVYMGVLYAYTLRILLKMELPRGNVAYMVTGFGGLGVVTHLAVYALRDKGTKLLQQYYSHFYKIMLVPLALLAVGLFARVHTYGVTPERYAIGMVLVWLGGLSAVSVIRRGRLHLKYVPMALCVLCLVAAAGPWGALDVSVRSQKARLETLLTQAGVLQANGAVAKVSKEVPFETRRQISSIVDFFYSNNAGDAIKGWVEPFTDEMKKKDDGSLAAATKCHRAFFSGCDNAMPSYVVKAWGMDYVWRWTVVEDSQEFHVDRRYEQYGLSWRKVSPFDYSVDISAYGLDKPWSQHLPLTADGTAPRTVVFSLTPQGQLTMTLVPQSAVPAQQDTDDHAVPPENPALEVQSAALHNSAPQWNEKDLPTGPALTFDLQKMADDLHAQKVTSLSAENQQLGTLSQENASGMKAEIRLNSLYGRIRDGHVALNSVSFQVLFTPPPKP